MRSLLLLIAFTAVLLSWIGSHRRQSEREHRAAKQLETQHLAILFEWPYEDPELERQLPDWARRGLELTLGSRATQALSSSTEQTDVDFTPVAELTGLKRIGVEHARITNFTAIAELMELQCIELYDTSVSDISAVRQLTKLRECRITHSPLRDISALANLKQLEYLDLEGTEVSDLAPIAQLHELRVLRFGLTRVRDVSPLSNLKHLKELWLSDSQDSELVIADYSPLYELQELKYLYMHGMDVSEEQVRELERRLPNCWIRHPYED